MLSFSLHITQLQNFHKTGLPLPPPPPPPPHWAIALRQIACEQRPFNLPRQVGKTRSLPLPDSIAWKIEGPLLAGYEAKETKLKRVGKFQSKAQDTLHAWYVAVLENSFSSKANLLVLFNKLLQLGHHTVLNKVVQHRESEGWIVLRSSGSNLYNRLFMSQARQTQHFAGRVKQVRSMRRGEEKNKGPVTSPLF